MQPRDLHRPPEKSGVVSCLQGSCLLFVLGLVYAALRAQPAEGPAVVYEHTPALRPVQGTSHVEALNDPVPRTFAEARRVSPTPGPRAAAEARPTPPPREGGPGRSLPAVKRPRNQAGATGLTSAPAPGLRPLSPLPPVYLDHLAYMDKHPGNGKAATVDSWKAGVGGYDPNPDPDSDPEPKPDRDRDRDPDPDPDPDPDAHPNQVRSWGAPPCTAAATGPSRCPCTRAAGAGR